jgi:hypothetical protein
VCVDKLDVVREAGTDGDGSTSQKIMFDTVDEEFEGAMDDINMGQYSEGSTGRSLDKADIPIQ